MSPQPDSQERALAGAAARPDRECWLLIVEDDPDIAETMAATIEDRGYHAETAANGAEALTRLRQAPLPALILLDLAMPVMDGREFRRAQLARPELAQIPVVILTADAGAARGSGLDAEGLLIKPVTLDGLMDVVARHCGSPER
jgi:CheY-like chemotaxis protein